MSKVAKNPEKYVKTFPFDENKIKGLKRGGLLVCGLVFIYFASMMLLLPTLLLPVLAVSTTTTAPSPHSYTFHALDTPNAQTAFNVMEGVSDLRQCYSACDTFDADKSTKPCAGFTLLNATGMYLCAYYHSSQHLMTPNPPERDLVGWYQQSAQPAPSPSPTPPLPPPRPKPAPTPPLVPGPDHYVATLHTDVGANATIVLSVTRSNAPHGADQFYRLCGNVGFYNGAALIRVVPDNMIEWGPSSNATLNGQFGHTPIPNDPMGALSNVKGTLTFNNDNGMGRATVLFLNLADNSKLDAKGLVPFATIAANDKRSFATAHAIFNPTPNSTAGVSAQAYANNGNAWIRKAYPGINFITGCSLSSAVH